MTEYPPYAPDERLFLPGFSVEGGTRVVIPSPIPRNLGIHLVESSPQGGKWEAIKALRPLMEPRPWLDMALRVLPGMRQSPMPIKEELIEAFPSFLDYKFLSPSVCSWWRAVDTLKVWRGAYVGINERGMCWSLDPLTASRYVAVGGCGEARPVLLEGTIERAACLPHRIERREIQVLVDPDRLTMRARYPLPLKNELLLATLLPRPLAGDL